MSFLKVNEDEMEFSKSQDYRILAAVLSIMFGHKFCADGLPDLIIHYITGPQTPGKNIVT